MPHPGLPALATIVVLLAGTPAAARADHESGHSEFNTPPVAVMKVRDYLDPGHFVNDQYELDATGSYDPDGHIVSTRWFLADVGWFESQAPNNLWRRWMQSGWQQVGLEVTDDRGATDVELQDILVSWRSPPSSDYLGADPFRKRPTAVFVPRYYRTAKLNRHGLPVRIECSFCTAEVELQLTRYRARRLGMSGQFPKSKIRMAYASSNFPPRFEHQFRLRPSARFRKALRRRRTVPILLRVRLLNMFLRPRITQAEIELRR